jgi:hypothetical protein
MAIYATCSISKITEDTLEGVEQCLGAEDPVDLHGFEHSRPDDVTVIFESIEVMTEDVGRLWDGAHVVNN